MISGRCTNRPYRVIGDGMIWYWRVTLILAIGLSSLLLAGCRKQPAASPAATPPASPMAVTVVATPAATLAPASANRQLPITATVNLAQTPAVTVPLSSSSFDLGRYRFRVIQLADDALFAADYEAAEALYKQVIEDEGLLAWNPALLLEPAVWQVNGGIPDLRDPDEQGRLSAYAHYRLMVVYAAEGEAMRVLLTYEVLRDTFLPGTAGAAYAGLGDAFWWRYQVHQDVAYSCSRARRYVDTYPEEILAPLGHDVYGWLGREYGRDEICPFF